VRFLPPARLAVAADAAAILVFAIVGLLSHRGGVSGRGLARDALPLLGGWFALALLVRLYTRPAAWRLAATWLLGITAGVALRAAILGHTHAGKEGAFLAVALGFILLFVLIGRAGASLRRSRPCRGSGSGRARAGSRARAGRSPADSP
jgi:peptidoglycan/LPS O-acetylase OafA/YrhL